MSAIAGVFHWGSQVVADRLLRMAGALQSLGPDASKVWHQQGFGLVHRLRRMTPEDAFERQPLQTRDGQLVLVADARIDNRDALASRYGWSPAEARLKPDSVFILEAYRRWGENCGQQLIGAYAFAVWNTLTQTLVLVRDPLGERTVHYYRGEGFVAFATSPKGLFALPEIPRELNEAKLADFLVLNHRDHESTHYRDILRVPPAHFFRISAQAYERVRYWQPDFSRRIEYARAEEYGEGLREVMNVAIKSHLRSSQGVGSFLSGGLDSSSCAVLAANQLRDRGRRLPCFTHVPPEGFAGKVTPGRYADERQRVRSIASRNGNMDIHWVASRSDRHVTDNLDDFFESASVPFRNSENRHWIEAILQQHQQQGLNVALMAQRGNSTISWHGATVLRQWLAEGEWGLLFRYARLLARQNQRSVPRILLTQAIAPRHSSLRGLLDRWRGADPTLGWQQHSPISPTFAAAQDVSARAASNNFDFRYRLPVDTRKARWQMVSGVDFLADTWAAYKARFGVEIRDPCIDRRVIEYCLALPLEQFIIDGKHRALVRRAFARDLPSEVTEGEGRGYQSPDWFHALAANRQRLEQDLVALEASELARRSLDLPRLRQLLANLPEQDIGGNSRASRHYRSLLSRGIMVGSYLRWFEGGNE